MTITVSIAAPAADCIGDEALSRFRLLRPVLESGVTVPALAACAAERNRKAA